MSTALGALAEQGFRAKEVSYLCNDVDIDIALGIEFGVDCTFDQFVDITRYIRTAIRNKHENPLTDLVHFAASPLEEGDNPNNQP
jgi:hypothetical protein